MRFLREILQKPVVGGDDKGLPDSRETVGWQVGTFALERISPDPASAAGSSAIWDAYCRWCEGKKAVPLAFAIFHSEFDKVAEAVGIVRRQSGAHVIYEGIQLCSEKGS